MITNAVVDISERLETINTSEAYADSCYIDQDNLLIPFVNLEVLEGAKHGVVSKLRFEFSYLIFSGVAYIAWVGLDTLGNRSIGQTRPERPGMGRLTDWIAVNQRNSGYELKVKFDSLSIFIPKESKSGDKWWTPWGTPNFIQNITNDDVDKFFALDGLPDRLMDYLATSFQTLERLKLINDSGEIAVEIEKTWLERATTQR